MSVERIPSIHLDDHMRSGPCDHRTGKVYVWVDYDILKKLQKAYDQVSTALPLLSWRIFIIRVALEQLYEKTRKVKGVPLSCRFFTNWTEVLAFNPEKFTPSIYDRLNKEY